jgi:hypothetical protein
VPRQFSTARRSLVARIRCVGAKRRGCRMAGAAVTARRPRPPSLRRIRRRLSSRAHMLRLMGSEKVHGHRWP